MSAIDLLIDPKMRVDVFRVVNSPELSKRFDRSDLVIKQGRD